MAPRGSEVWYILVLLGHLLFYQTESSALDVTLEFLELQTTQNACNLSST